MTDYELYLEKFATKHEITKEEAEQMLIVKETKKFYEGEHRDAGERMESVH